MQLTKLKSSRRAIEEWSLSHCSNGSIQAAQEGHGLPPLQAMLGVFMCGFVLSLQLTELLRWYATTFRDPMMLHPPEWFKAFIYCEAALQLPFFPVAAYAFLKGWCEQHVRTCPMQHFCTAHSVQGWFIYQS